MPVGIVVVVVQTRQRGLERHLLMKMGSLHLRIAWDVVREMGEMETKTRGLVVCWNLGLESYFDPPRDLEEAGLLYELTIGSNNGRMRRQLTIVHVGWCIRASA